MFLSSLSGLLWDTWNEWLEDKAPRLGAALSFYTLFSLAPLVVIIIGILGLVHGEEAAKDETLSQIESQVGPHGGPAIRAMVESASQPGSGILGTALGIGMLLFGATGLFIQLQDALNTIWEVKPKADRGWLMAIKDRLLSFAMVLVVALLLFASVVVSAVLAGFAGLFGDWGTSLRGYVIDLPINFLILTLLFAMVFRVLPDVHVAWRDVWLGAVVTAGLFILGKFLIGMYLGYSGVASGYGAAGSLAALLLWVYYSAQIFLFGAELTQVNAKRRGARIEPTAHAERVDELQRAKEGIAHH